MRPRHRRRYELAPPGVFSGAPRWVTPIHRCPLDHVLEVGSLRDAVREHSIASNLRTPLSDLASAERTSIRPGGGGGGGGGGELRRLRDDFAGAPILTVTNLHAVDVWRSGLLGVETKRRLEAKFGYIGGGWCCATKRDKQAGLPNNHGFHLDVMPPADLRLDAESGAREEAGPVET